MKLITITFFAFFLFLARLSTQTPTNNQLCPCTAGTMPVSPFAFRMANSYLTLPSCAYIAATGAIDNPTWWKFIPTSNSTTFTFTNYNCNAAVGTSCGIATQLTLWQGSACGNLTYTAYNLFETPLQVTYTTIPNVYNYLQFDGLCGSQCSFDVTYSAAVLPIELVAFDAKKVNKTNVLLDWTTLTEQNNAYFLIEKSKDGVSFETIGKVAGHGTTLKKQTYSFTDTRASEGENYYRLAQFDTDGSSSLSKIIAVSLEHSLAVSISPNPILDFFTLSLPTSKTSREVNIQVFDRNGQILITQNEVLDTDNHRIRVAADGLPQGFYIVETTVNGFKSIEKVIKL